MDEYLKRLTELISEDYLKNASLELQENKNDANSFVISSPMTAYRPKINKVLFARINLKSKTPYISFREKYKPLFDKINIPTYEMKSDAGYFRIAIDDFFCDNLFKDVSIKKDLSEVLNKMFLDCMNFPTFGCCSKYNQCSDMKKCIHDDQLYATACMYRKNLDAGRIFYGINKNV